MYWSISTSTIAMPAPERKDFLYEGIVPLDGSGNFTSSWFDTSGIVTVRAVANFGPLSTPLASLYLEEAMTADGVNPVSLRVAQVSLTTGYGELDPVARFIRFVARGGPAGSEFFFTVRGV